MKFRTLIVDDEIPARERLKNLLAAHSNEIEVVGEAENGLDCIAKIESLKPDLVFLDIQMPGANGFEVLKQISHTPIIVFCTAYDEYALKAFETNSIDYIVKPVKSDRIAKTIDKLEALHETSVRMDKLKIVEQLIQSAPKKEITTIPVKLGERMLFLPIENVAFFKADEKYVEIHTVDGKEYVSDYSLKELELKLEDRFIRIQRALLVNSLRIIEVKKHYYSRFTITVDDVFKTKLISGRSYNKIIQQLSQL
ncbi:response regulator transcription factor [Prolixibacteraceae bacterium JC049]|nr:response regulator transcription factor [Prolixibacteraceae bacterium JC049]